MAASLLPTEIVNLELHGLVGAGVVLGEEERRVGELLARRREHVVFFEEELVFVEFHPVEAEGVDKVADVLDAVVVYDWMGLR